MRCVNVSLIYLYLGFVSYEITLQSKAIYDLFWLVLAQVFCLVRISTFLQYIFRLVSYTFTYSQGHSCSIYMFRGIFFLLDKTLSTDVMWRNFKNIDHLLYKEFVISEGNRLRTAKSKSGTRNETQTLLERKLLKSLGWEDGRWQEFVLFGNLLSLFELRLV